MKWPQEVHAQEGLGRKCEGCSYITQKSYYFFYFMRPVSFRNMSCLQLAADLESRGGLGGCSK